MTDLEGVTQEQLLAYQEKLQNAVALIDDVVEKKEEKPTVEDLQNAAETIFQQFEKGEEDLHKLSKKALIVLDRAKVESVLKQPKTKELKQLLKQMRKQLKQALKAIKPLIKQTNGTEVDAEKKAPKDIEVFLFGEKIVCSITDAGSALRALEQIEQSLKKNSIPPEQKQQNIDNFTAIKEGLEKYYFPGDTAISDHIDSIIQLINKSADKSEKEIKAEKIETPSLRTIKDSVLLSEMNYGQVKRQLGLLEENIKAFKSLENRQPGGEVPLRMDFDDLKKYFEKRFNIKYTEKTKVTSGKLEEPKIKPGDDLDGLEVIDVQEDLKQEKPPKKETSPSSQTKLTTLLTEPPLEEMKKEDIKDRIIPMLKWKIKQAANLTVKKYIESDLELTQKYYEKKYGTKKSIAKTPLKPDSKETKKVEKAPPLRVYSNNPGLKITRPTPRFPAIQNKIKPELLKQSDLKDRLQFLNAVVEIAKSKDLKATFNKYELLNNKKDREALRKLETVLKEEIKTLIAEDLKTVKDGKSLKSFNLTVRAKFMKYAGHGMSYDDAEEILNKLIKKIDEETTKNTKKTTESISFTPEVKKSDEYKALENTVKEIRNKIPTKRSDRQKEIIRLKNADPFLKLVMEGKLIPRALVKSDFSIKPNISAQELVQKIRAKTEVLKTITESNNRFLPNVHNEALEGIINVIRENLPKEPSGRRKEITRLRTLDPFLGFIAEGDSILNAIAKSDPSITTKISKEELGVKLKEKAQFLKEIAKSKNGETISGSKEVIDAAKVKEKEQNKKLKILLQIITQKNPEIITKIDKLFGILGKDTQGEENKIRLNAAKKSIRIKLYKKIPATILRKSTGESFDEKIEKIEKRIPKYMREAKVISSSLNNLLNGLINELLLLLPKEIAKPLIIEKKETTSSKEEKKEKKEKKVSISELPKSIPWALRDAVDEVTKNNPKNRELFILAWEILKGEIKERPWHASLQKIIKVNWKELIEFAQDTKDDESKQALRKLLKTTLNNLSKVLTEKTIEGLEIENQHVELKFLLTSIARKNPELRTKINRLFDILKVDPKTLKDEEDRKFLIEVQQDIKHTLYNEIPDIILDTPPDSLNEKMQRIGDMSLRQKTKKIEPILNEINELDEFIDELIKILPDIKSSTVSGTETTDSSFDSDSTDPPPTDGASGESGAESDPATPPPGVDPSSTDTSEKEKDGEENKETESSAPKTAKETITDRKITKLVEVVLEDPSLFSRDDPASLAIIDLVKNSKKEINFAELKGFLQKPDLAVDEIVSEMVDNNTAEELKANLTAMERRYNKIKEDIEGLRKRKNVRGVEPKEIEKIEEQIEKLYSGWTDENDEYHEGLYALDDYIKRCKTAINLKDNTMSYSSPRHVLTMINFYLERDKGTKPIDLFRKIEHQIESQMNKAYEKTGWWSKGISSLGNNFAVNVFKPTLTTTLKGLAEDNYFKSIGPDKMAELAEGCDDLGKTEGWVKGLEGNAEAHMRTTVPRLIAYLEFALRNVDGTNIKNASSRENVRKLIGHLKNVRHQHITEQLKNKFEGKNVNNTQRMISYFNELDKATVTHDRITKKLITRGSKKTVAKNFLKYVGGGSAAVAGTVGLTAAALSLGPPLASAIFLGAVPAAAAWRTGKVIKPEHKIARGTAKIAQRLTIANAVGLAALAPVTWPIWPALALAGVTLLPKRAAIKKYKELKPVVAEGADAAKNVYKAGKWTTGKAWWLTKFGVKSGVMLSTLGLPLFSKSGRDWFIGKKSSSPKKKKTTKSTPNFQSKPSPAPA